MISVRQLIESDTNLKTTTMATTIDLSGTFCSYLRISICWVPLITDPPITTKKSKHDRNVADDENRTRQI